MLNHNQKLDIVSIRDFSKEKVLEIIKLAKTLEEHPRPELLQNKIVSILFFEPSTRTRLSFVSAAERLGAQILNFDSVVGTSVTKGETLADTIKMVDCYSDVIVMRHPHDGAARFVADISDISVINAGDGSNQHPTQTLLDLYSIMKKRKSLEGLKIGFVGDLKYGRTVHSLSMALAWFGAKMYFISPEALKMPSYLISSLKKQKVDYEELSDYKEILKDLDVLYMTRIQKERFADEMEYQKLKGIYVIKAKDLIGNCKDDLMLMHPLPRVDEIAIDVDETPYAYYFKQAQNGLYVRQALLALCLEKHGALV
jgi:aspartate carbamoyltransferase catalytic subunit